MPFHCRVWALLIAITALVPATTAAQDDDVPELTPIPNPLLFNDGDQHATADTWPDRRKEIIELIQSIEYGHAPNVQLRPINRGVTVEGPLTVRGGVKYEYTYTIGDEKPMDMRIDLYFPNDAKKPYPVIVRFGLGAEHAEAALARGYAFACFEHTLLDPDTEGHDVAGSAQLAYPDYDWGSLRVWAWGASRVLDALATHENIDIERSVVTGHSRTGKATLLAGALDERFAIVVPNGSGAGGAAMFRGAGSGYGDGAETLELITRESRFKSWFHKDFGEWADREDELPFDQHFLRALVAPRVVLSTDSFGDRWAHPRGAQRAWQLAQPVFDMLGVPGHNLVHMREGGHDQLDTDFEALLDVADAVFQNRPIPSGFSDAPYPQR